MDGFSLDTQASGATPAELDAVFFAAFGPGRYAKTAERLREGNRADPDLGQIARSASGELVAAASLWPVRAGHAEAWLLGPVAVVPSFANLGLGRSLVRRALEVVDIHAPRPVVLVGSPDYFSPFGFVPMPESLRLPGPVDPARALIRVGARRGVPAGEITVPPGAMQSSSG